MEDTLDLDRRSRVLNEGEVRYDIRSNRSKKRKMKGMDNDFDDEVISLSVPTEDDLSSAQGTVNDYEVATSRTEEISNGTVVAKAGNMAFKSRSSKKVSFNAVVDSYFINEETLHSRKNKHNQSFPRSILKKQTSSSMRKNKRAKIRMKTRTIGESVSKNVKLKTPKQTRALAYLDTWKHHNADWKFEKVIQTWLLKNMFNDSMVPNKKFDLLLEYVADMRGAAVLLAQQSSLKLIEDWKRTSENNDVTQESSYLRAKLVLQSLKK